MRSEVDLDKILRLPEALEILFRHKITQEQAKNWWTGGQRIGNDDSRDAIVHVNHSATLNGVQTSVVVKQWAVRNHAIHEVQMHCAAWYGFTPECKEHLSMPANMDFEAPVDEKTYTVQSLVVGPKDTITETVRGLADTEKQEGRIRLHLTKEERMALVSKYARMLACTHCARIWHQDMHHQNVLIIHNLPLFIQNKNSPHSKIPLRFEWKLIDWGRAEQLTDPKESFDPGLEEKFNMNERLYDMFVSDDFTQEQLLRHLQDEHNEHIRKITDQCRENYLGEYPAQRQYD